MNVAELGEVIVVVAELVARVRVEVIRLERDILVARERIERHVAKRPVRINGLNEDVAARIDGGPLCRIRVDL